MSTVPPTRRADDARREVSQRSLGTAIDHIARNVRRVYLARTGPSGLPLPVRDVHPKTHGLVKARFRVLPEEAFETIQARTGHDLRRGAFREPGREYEAWLRFSNSNKRPRPDTEPDGRGLAIKLKEVYGQRLEPPRVGAVSELGGPPTALAEPGEQDFILLNGPAFFAKNAEEMGEVSELEARDAFPGAFFVGRTAGFMALLAMMRNQAGSPLDITYFSQTPYALGEYVVKYRVQRRNGRPYADKVRGTDGLRQALRAELGQLAEGSSVTLEFAVQVAYQSDDFLIDDATQVWREDLSPFWPIAEVVLERQSVGDAGNLSDADGLAFNPFNGLSEHEPLGSINRARGVVYEVSRQLRTELSRLPAAAAHVRLPGAVVQRPSRIGLFFLAPKRAAKTLGRWWSRLMARLRKRLTDFLRRAGRWPLELLLRPWAGLIPLGLLLLLGARAWTHPTQPFEVALTSWMPSEAAIPDAVLRPEYASAEARRSLLSDPRYVFRYLPTGSEFDGGVPYWIYRVLPRIAPERFDHAEDYGAVGLGPADDQDYYLDYHGLPRGLVLSDQMIHVLGNDVKVRVKVVSFNCASCHRGEFRDRDGERVFADGMPNNVLDTAGYKTRVYGTIQDPRFTADRVIEEIDALLAELHRRRPLDAAGRELPEELSCAERIAYRLLVQEVKRRTGKKDITWIHQRPENGLGRVDAFGALRFEFLGFDPKTDGNIATVDLPSIWNEAPAMRPVQHWDGNTSDVRGRNFGAIIGVGGSPLSVHQRSVGEVAKWLGTLRPPRYPLGAPEPALVAEGEAVYSRHCASCHGKYEPDASATRLIAATDCMRRGVDVGTDASRLDAMGSEFVDRLNRFGDGAGVWGRDAFRVPSGYLCPPLDGIWARAPFLHNGSVPTLEALLTSADDRPEEFYRGNTVYDGEAGGFRTDLPTGEDARRAFLFRTSERGNAATGHEFGPGLGDGERSEAEVEAERRALIAYLLTL